MSQTVDRLKELLFDQETRALDALSRRLDTVSETERVRRSEMERQLHDVYERAGSNDRLQRSVATVLDGALRTAEVERHEEISSAIAPLVINTIKAELRNSREGLVESLYPLTGRMVKAYVASAINDLMDRVQRRLESNALVLRLTSILTGRPMAELAIADAQRLELEELYLIRRGTGELVGRWPEDLGTANRDQMMSGVLTAINDFASEAFKGEGAMLRRIDLGAARVYLRASPLFLLAARCSGSAPAAVEQEIDSAFLDIITRYHELCVPGSPDPSLFRRLLAGLYRRLDITLAEKQSALRAARTRPLRSLLLTLGLPLLAAMSWTLYAKYEATRTLAVAEHILSTDRGLRGYPTRARVADYGALVTIEGLAPDASAKTALVGRLEGALPQAKIVDNLSVVPNGGAALEPRVAELQREMAAGEAARLRADVVRLLDRAARRLDTSLADLALAKGSMPKKAAGSIDGEVAALEVALQGITAQRAALMDSAGSVNRPETAARLYALAGDLRNAMANLASAGALASDVRRPRSTPAPASLLAAADDLDLESERLAASAAASASARRTRPVTPRERLLEFVQSNAVFFGYVAEYRHPARVEQMLDSLAELIKEANVVVRVVGYTDERGTIPRNNTVSWQRAERVINELIARGVPATRLVAVGRNNVIDLSPTVGLTSSNRRVEFEIGFDGELGE